MAKKRAKWGSKSRSCVNCGTKNPARVRTCKQCGSNPKEKKAEAANGAVETTLQLEF